MFEFMVACNEASGTLIAVFFTNQPMMSDALNIIDNFDCQTCKASFPDDERMIKGKLVKKDANEELRRMQCALSADGKAMQDVHPGPRHKRTPSPYLR